MNLQRSTDRILTTHVGSLPRAKDLLELMKAKMTRRGYVPELYEARVRSAVAECVRKQAESGIDILNDGEQSKPGFFTYVAERLEGFEPRPDRRCKCGPWKSPLFRSITSNTSRRRWAEVRSPR